MISEEEMIETSEGNDDGWHRAGTPNPWPSNVRRHYFRKEKTLCGKYFWRDRWINSEDDKGPEVRMPATDYVRYTKLLDYLEEVLHKEGRSK